MSWKELLQDLVKTGPTNLKKILEVAENLPSDSTLRGLNDTANRIIPYLPMLERAIGDGNLKNLDRLLKRIPDQKTLNRLVEALPMLEKMPDKETLSKLLDKADSLEKFMSTLEEK